MRKRRVLGAVLALVALAAAWGAVWLVFPSDRTPTGAYYRVVRAVNRGVPEELFPYLETTAQHAAFSLHHYSKASLAAIDAHYPDAQKEPTRSQLLPLARAAEGPGVFVSYAQRFGWIDRLRRDLSGVAKVEIEGERATVETVRGTRYAFRRRENGIWGLTLFTSRLVADAEKAARDHAMIQEAARDFTGRPIEPGQR